ncbi:glycosyltransferase, partial [bacterium]|nr:glycosyltransferase [bacterium]
MNHIPEAPPSFSVVIPTQGRCDLVEKLLISLQRAITQSKVAVEVIIIDDSPKPERDEIERLCQQYGARYLSGPHSVREKRNIGIEKSRGEIVLFTDSDCEVDACIFDEHLKLYAEADTAGVLGITEFTGKENITWKIISRTMFLDSFSFAKTLNEVTDFAPWGTCTNLSFRKEVLEDVGKFDTTFPFRLGGDDTELGVRVNEAGYKIKMNPNAVVFHTRETWSRWVALIERAFRWGRADFHILKKHPQLGHIAFPSFFTVLLLIALACLAYILTGHSDIAVMVIVVWTFSTLLMEAIIKVIIAGEKPHFIFFELIATLLNLVFDAGAIFESLRRG